MRYTGTVLGGPYDGDVWDFDTNLVIMEDPLTEEQEMMSYISPMTLTVIDTSAPVSYMYEWVHDDDMRGWWVRGKRPM